MEKSRDYFNQYLELGKKGDWLNAWVKLLMAMLQNPKFDNTAQDVFKEIANMDFPLITMGIDLNGREWQMTMSAIFEDAIDHDGPQCVVACKILNQNYSFYGAGNLPAMERCLEKYPDYLSFRNAMEEKAKKLGFMV